MIGPSGIKKNACCWQASRVGKIRRFNAPALWLQGEKLPAMRGVICALI
jgi:hypothetical protein